MRIRNIVTTKTLMFAALLFAFVRTDSAQAELYVGLDSNGITIGTSPVSFAQYDDLVSFARYDAAPYHAYNYGPPPPHYRYVDNRKDPHRYHYPPPPRAYKPYPPPAYKRPYGPPPRYYGHPGFNKGYGYKKHPHPGYKKGYGYKKYPHPGYKKGYGYKKYPHPGYKKGYKKHEVRRPAPPPWNAWNRR
jgi:hypothetical protein